MTTSREELRASSWAHYDPGNRNSPRPMTTRRNFIRNSAGAMAAIAFVGCDLLAARGAQAQPARRRREVVVSGRRVKTVDVHAHCAVPEAMALMGLNAAPQTLIMGQDRIRAMDEQGIDVEALSINPYWYKAERDLARTLIRLQNEKLAELCASRPDRFPGLKICAAHGGGYLPSYAARSDAGCVTFPDRCTKPLKKRPTEYLRALYYDSIVFTPEALRHLAAEVGSGQIVMGTDYPFPWMKTAVDHILNTPGLSDAERAAMLGETASRLLGIKP